VPAAAATLSAGASSSLRGAGGAVIARATVSGGGASAAAASAPRLTVTVRRKAHGRLKAMACGDTCSPLRALGTRPVRLRVASASGRVRVVVAR
jgi:hypothetical protein